MSHVIYLRPPRMRGKLRAPGHSGLRTPHTPQAQPPSAEKKKADTMQVFFACRKTESHALRGTMPTRNCLPNRFLFEGGLVILTGGMTRGTNFYYAVCIDAEESSL